MTAVSRRESVVTGGEPIKMAGGRALVPLGPRLAGQPISPADFAGRLTKWASDALCNVNRRNLRP